MVGLTAAMLEWSFCKRIALSLIHIVRKLRTIVCPYLLGWCCVGTVCQCRTTGEKPIGSEKCRILAMDYTDFLTHGRSSE